MKGTFFVLSFLLICGLTHALRKSTCKILALEGGGTKGAYQSGAFRAMAEFLPPDEIKYDVIAGASVGSLNGIVFASTEIGNEKLASAKMTELWANIKSDNVLINWPYFGVIRGFFDKNSFLDNSPLFGYVTSLLKQWGGKVHRKYSITLGNIKTAELFIATESVGVPNLPSYILASAAVPGIFPYSVINGSLFMDGGTMDNLNLRGGIARCREIVGDDDSAITIDIIMTNPTYKCSEMNMKGVNSYTLYSRGNEVSEKVTGYWYIKDALEAFPLTNFRYIVVPKESLPNYPVIALSFDRETLTKSEKIGYEQVKELLTEGAKKDFRREFKEFAAKPREKIRLH